MGQNVSSAVMQQRREPHDSLDDFPTPPWATRALCDWIWLVTSPGPFSVAREPAANRGHMVRVLEEYFRRVEAGDVRDYLFGPLPKVVNWTITNPPFRLAEAFIDRALQSSASGVAVIVRTAFLEGIGRHERLFSVRPPSDILQFSERVVMHKGRLSARGSTATAYCWLVWRPGQSGTRFHWIAPCRKLLERAADYSTDHSAEQSRGELA